MLCDLISAQAAVLERNVSPQVAATYKRATIAGLMDLGVLLRGQLGELSDHDARRLAAAAMVTVGALWPQCQPSAAMLTAYEADPGLAALRLDFEPALREMPRSLHLRHPGPRRQIAGPGREEIRAPLAKAWQHCRSSSGAPYWGSDRHQREQQLRRVGLGQGGERHTA